MSESIFIKLITAGDGGVGKTTLLHRYVEGKFLTDTKMTLGVDFLVKEIKAGGEKTCMLQIWDFGGQDHFRHLLQRYSLGARGAILVFDLTRFQTLENIEQWVNICRHYDKDLPIIFLGSKNDLKNEIVIHDDMVEEMLAHFGFLKYLKVSSKSGENVDVAFDILTKAILLNKDGK